MSNQPTDEIFNEIKQKSIELWQKRYSDEFGYVTEKTSYIEGVNNIKDNWSAIIGMFDDENQGLLYLSLSKEALKFLYSQSDRYSINIPWWMIGVDKDVR